MGSNRRADAVTDQILQNGSGLPQEIMLTILEYACLLPPLPTSVTGPGRESALDITMILTLSTLSRTLYARITTLLYRDVQITRPSQLAALHRTLTSRPALGRLIRTAWIGSADEWGGDRYPPIVDEAVISSLQEIDKLPHGIAVGTRWRPDITPPRLSMIQEAIKEAAAFLGHDQTGITLMRQLIPANEGGQAITYSEYTCRAYELQAALDLYLIRLRAFEKEQRASHGASYMLDSGRTDYPIFKMLRKGLDVSLLDSKDLLLCTSDMIQAHMARSRSLDRFDHPLLYARSGAICLVFGTQVESPLRFRSAIDGHGAPSDPDADSGRPNGSVAGEDVADVWASDDLDDIIPGWPTPRSLDPCLPSTTTLGSLLALTRSFLSFTPHLERLALTGFLERAVAGDRAGVDLRQLKVLSLGPPPPHWNSPLRLHHQSLSSVRKLQINGCMLFREEAKAIAGEGGAMPDLDEFRWTMWASHTLNHPLTLVDTLEACASHPQSSRRTKPCQVRARLHPLDLHAFQTDSPVELRDRGEDLLSVKAIDTSVERGPHVTAEGEALSEISAGWQMKDPVQTLRQEWKEELRNTLVR